VLQTPATSATPPASATINNAGNIDTTVVIVVAIVATVVVVVIIVIVVLFFLYKRSKLQHATNTNAPRSEETASTQLSNVTAVPHGNVNDDVTVVETRGNTVDVSGQLLSASAASPGLVTLELKSGQSRFAQQPPVSAGSTQQHTNARPTTHNFHDVTDGAAVDDSDVYEIVNDNDLSDSFPDDAKANEVAFKTRRASEMEQDGCGQYVNFPDTELYSRLGPKSPDNPYTSL
jgi:hypothetical protein